MPSASFQPRLLSHSELGRIGPIAPACTLARCFLTLPASTAICEVLLYKRKVGFDFTHALEGLDRRAYLPKHLHETISRCPLRYRGGCNAFSSAQLRLTSAGNSVEMNLVKLGAAGV